MQSTMQRWAAWRPGALLLNRCSSSAFALAAATAEARRAARPAEKAVDLTVASVTTGPYGRTPSPELILQ